jgi:plasmid stabilization system protein ParE
VKIVWTEPARQDLRQIFEYIAEENPNAARKLLSEIKEQAVFLQDNPHLGRMGRVDGTREKEFARIEALCVENWI